MSNQILKKNIYRGKNFNLKIMKELSWSLLCDALSLSV